MDFIELSKIQVDFKDLLASSMPYHTSIEIILIDQRDPAIPHVFELLEPSSSLKEGNHHHIKLREHHFVLVGHLQKLDKHKKHLILTNQNSISYSHLIVARENPGHHYEENDFIAGLQALMDALKLKDIASKLKRKPLDPSTSAPVSLSSKETPRYCSMRPHSDDPRIATIDALLDRNHKRLFEVHL